MEDWYDHVEVCVPNKKFENTLMTRLEQVPSDDDDDDADEDEEKEPIINNFVKNLREEFMMHLIQHVEQSVTALFHFNI